MSISNKKAIRLILRISEGYKPTHQEQRHLNELTELDLSDTLVNSLKGISRLTNLESLNLSNIQVSSLKEIRGLTNLKNLKLSNTQVSSLEEIRRLTNLQELWLNNTQIRSLDEIRGLTNLKYLWLNNTQISSLEEISGLANLESLGLSNTQVCSLEGIHELMNLQYLGLLNTQVSSLKEIRALTNLKYLRLSNTQISSLEEIHGLTNLKYLDLSNTQVSALEGISGLTNLQELYLSNTQVSSLKGINELTNLKYLGLSNTRVSSLKGIGELINLLYLGLSNTQVSSLEEIRGLTNLQHLGLSNTQVSSLEEIRGLTNLECLSISGTSLDSIPQWLAKKKLPFKTDVDWGLESAVYMKDVQLTEQPVSLFSQSHELIEAYYQEEQVPVNEAKVIFLGDGGVGKTYTIYRIKNSGKEPKEGEIKTTPGVSISQYRRSGKATINFWDFGGQEIMHSMHRCFLTERTCYVVMVSNRWSEVTRQARRWLRNIESFAPDSKVILAVNLWEGVADRDLDYKRLLNEFPNLLRVEKYTATHSKEIERLAQIIEEEVDNLHSVKMKFPKSWAEIMGKLRKMTDDSCKSLNYITKEKYRTICENAELKVGDITLWLLEWFNDLGVCFSYHKNAKNGSELANYMILNPAWLTNAVYIIVNNCQENSEQGRIPHKEILRVLNQPTKFVVAELEYSNTELRYILEVMRKFRLSYKVGNSREFVPALCPNLTPDDLHPTDFTSRVRCEIRYDYLPDTVVHRLMVDCYKKLNYDKCWLKGLCIDEREACGLLAVCDMGKDDDVLYIDVYKVGDEAISKSESTQSLLRTLLNKLEKINSDLNLTSTTWICSNDEHKAAFQLSTLLRALKLGETSVQYTADGGFKLYNIRELLGQIFDVPIKINLSTSETGNKELNLDKFDQEYLFLKPVWTMFYSILERFMEATPKDKAGNFITINITGSGSISSVGPVIDSPSASANSEVNVVQSNSELSRQFEQFKDKLDFLQELNETQKDDFCEAIGELLDKLDESGEIPAKEKKPLKRMFNMLGDVAKTAIMATATSAGSEFGKFLAKAVD